jgi:hypothetical protein
LDRLSSENQWTHIAIVATSANTGEFYVDGQSVSFDGLIFTRNSDTDSFEGKLDEVMIYQRAFPSRKFAILPVGAFWTFPEINSTQFL